MISRKVRLRCPKRRMTSSSTSIRRSSLLAAGSDAFAGGLAGSLPEPARRAAIRAELNCHSRNTRQGAPAADTNQPPAPVDQVGDAADSSRSWVSPPREFRAVATWPVIWRSNSCTASRWSGFASAVASEVGAEIVAPRPPPQFAARAGPFRHAMTRRPQSQPGRRVRPRRERPEGPRNSSSTPNAAPAI